MEQELNFKIGDVTKRQCNNPCNYKHRDFPLGILFITHASRSMPKAVPLNTLLILLIRNESLNKKYCWGVKQKTLPFWKGFFILEGYQILNACDSIFLNLSVKRGKSNVHQTRGFCFISFCMIQYF